MINVYLHFLSIFQNQIKSSNIIEVFGTNFALNIPNKSGGLTMKAKNLTVGLVLLMLISACSSSRLAGPGVYYDDIYYVPGVTRENINDAFSPVPAISKEEQKAENRAIAQQQREYEQTLKAGEQDTRDFTALQEEYASLLSNDSIQELDTLVYYNDETGYWVDGFDGSTMDRDYAERMIRFHGPFIRIPYYSPFYSEVVYFNNYDWNVYVDGNYAYAFPTWTNRWYNSFYYNSWGYPGWSWSMSWGYPYYNYWNYGYGWYDPFYYSYYHPFHDPYWYSPYYYHYPGYRDGYWSGGSSTADNRTYYSGMQTGLSSNTRPSTNFSSREILKRSSGERASITTQSGTRITRDAQGNQQYESKSGTVYTRSARSASGEQNLKSGNTSAPQEPATRANNRTVQQSNTRRSYTPSYTKPEDNSRPTYNRSSYTRTSGTNRPTPTTGTVRSSNTGTRQVQSSSSTPRSSTGTTPRATSSQRSTGGSSVVTPSSSSRSRSTTTYQRGSSSNSSRSTSGTTYSAPSRSSSSSSSYTPSSSSSGRSSSSGSSSSGSRSSSGSSGGSTIRQGRR